MFLRSFLLFWPVERSNTTIKLIIDDEQRNSTLINTYIDDVVARGMIEFGAAFPLITKAFHAPEVSIYRSGHDRQQYLMFKADLFTNATYVAFSDTDAFFHSYVDVDDIFYDDKPIIHGTIGYFRKVGRDKIKRDWAQSTWYALGDEEPMMCMSYFPVIIKVSHLVDLREFIRKRFDAKSFDDVFKSKMHKNNALCQFNIMCAFIWTNKRDEYIWRIHDTSPWWDGKKPAPNFGQWSESWIFNEVHGKIPKPMVATHYRYRYKGVSKPLVGYPENVNSIYLEGVCHTLPYHHHLLHQLGFDKKEINCTAFIQKNYYFTEAYLFEEANFFTAANESTLSDMNYLRDQRIDRFTNCDMFFMRDAWIQRFHI